ncbi:MAG: hypothetical protein QW175_07875 [Candidatus Bathyarchaeia archaeon]
MRSDQHTVNGLTAYKLGTAQTTTYVSIPLDYGEKEDDLRVDVAVRHADGSETLLLDKYVIGSVGSRSGYLSKTWSCPQTSLSPTDAVVIRIYNFPYQWIPGQPYMLVAEFVTEQLGGQSLDASTWTFYLYVYVLTAGVAYFRFGTSTYNSRIANFAWTLAPTRVWHNIDFISFNVKAKAWSIIQTEVLTVTVKQWNFIEVFVFNLAIRQWVNLQSLDYTVLTRKWNIVDLLTFHLVSGIVKLWRTIQNVIFNIAAGQWSILDRLTFTINLARLPLAVIASLVILTIIVIASIKKQSRES